MDKMEGLLFDLNELPPEEEDEKNSMCFQPQSTRSTTLFPTSSFSPKPEGYQGIANNHAFTHTASGSGFQPFVRADDNNMGKPDVTNQDLPFLSTRHSDSEHSGFSKVVAPAAPVVQATQKEEGELSEFEGTSDSEVVVNSSTKCDDISFGDAGEQKENTQNECSSQSAEYRSSGYGVHESGGKVADNSTVARCESGAKVESVSKGDDVVNGSPETSQVVKMKEVKGTEAIHALRIATNPLKRPKLDEHKEAMLGKKRARKTMFINVEDAKQTSAMKTSTPRRQNCFPAPIVTRTVKESCRSGSAVVDHYAEKQSEAITKDQRQLDSSCESPHYTDLGDQKIEPNGSFNSAARQRSKKLDNNESSSEASLQTSRQGSWKQPLDPKQSKNPAIMSKKPLAVRQNHDDVNLGNNKQLQLKKPTSSSMQHQDSSVERLLREVTNEKFWHNPEDAELQCVPGSFESVDEYVRVFEPLLFEECRAQLFSTWEELAETSSRDAYIMVRVKAVERRERGWYDAIVLPVHECKWTFKEGDVAVLSTLRPGAVRSGRRNMNSSFNESEADHGLSGKVAGTVRRYIPVDTRESSSGAILHFYVGEVYDYSSKASEDHIIRKLQAHGIWYLTVLGSLATTQREYVSLHAFRRLSVQMQTAILKPSPDHFPKCREQPPAIPECFTPSFVDHLRKTFNGPQLAAIQWAAMHTAAGTSGGATKKPDPWPFTLVQGPPGTGKTHTVWGMLNVIHLVQYQHYYTALLKKLAPESYKQNVDTSPDTMGTGSIDEVLQNMDQNLLRTLPKLCPKPRMLVCAPSNAATDELLARVLERGFIDGEMRVYRPDVARVGVDTQNRAAQAVSVERRTEQLLLKGRDEVIGWLHHLKAREAQFSQQIAILQRELSAAAAVGRAQGSVGVDPDVLIARGYGRDVLLKNLAAAVEGRDKVLVEMSRLLILEPKFHAGSNFNLEDARTSLEASFANEAEIVFTTVSSSGRKLFSRLTHGFDMVVIDEAAQASEVAILPPLSLGAARCVLVGDPQQLPATVISKAAGTLQYSRSLFERFQQAGCPTMLLSVQYRMHPQIRDFPSRHFYQGRLTDSESVVSLADEAYYQDPFLQPYVFYDITHGRECHHGGSVSYQNIHEAQFALRLYEHLQKFLKSNCEKKVTVGIITPYKLQLKCLQREFKEVLSSEEGKDIYINTVDAFQGQERDVVIMSCVRASNHGVGFVADIRRMNVALTRARRALWVVGNANALMQSDDWESLIADAKSRECFMDMGSIPKDFLVLKGSSNAPGRPTSTSMNTLRSGSSRLRKFEIMADAKPDGHSENEGKSNSSHLPRNGSYKNLKSMHNSLDELAQSSDRDGLQCGISRRTSGFGR